MVLDILLSQHPFNIPGKQTTHKNKRVIKYQYQKQILKKLKNLSKD
jgi:hypothetical protein